MSRWRAIFKKDVSFWTGMAQTAWSATGIGDFVDAALLCHSGVMNAGGGGKAVLCAVGKEFGENMVTDTVYEAMEVGGCSEARSILNAVLIFRTVYSFVDAANSAVNAKCFKDAYKDKDWEAGRRGWRRLLKILVCWGIRRKKWFINVK